MSDGSFSFASLVKPGEGSRRALANHLKVCSPREKGRPHWRYSGACAFLLEHGTYFNGRELPAELEHLRGSFRQCHLNALAAAEADTTLRYFTGIYMVSGAACHHSWCVDKLDQLVEVTLPNATMRGENPVTAKTPGGYAAPMLTPAHWAYVGVEYDTAFVRLHQGERGLPILNPYNQGEDGELGCYLRSEDAPMWALPYEKSGFPVPPAPDPCLDCFGWGCGACNDTGIAP